MRKEMKTIHAMKIANVSRGLNDTLLDKVDEIIKRAIWDVDNERGYQFNKMMIYGRTLTLHNIIVAYYDDINVIEFGKYAYGKTSKEIKRFAEMKGANLIRLKDFYKFLPLYGDDGYRFKIY